MASTRTVIGALIVLIISWFVFVTCADSCSRRINKKYGDRFIMHQNTAPRQTPAPEAYYYNGDVNDVRYRVIDDYDMDNDPIYRDVDYGYYDSYRTSHPSYHSTPRMSNTGAAVTGAAVGAAATGLYMHNKNKKLKAEHNSKLKAKQAELDATKKKLKSTQQSRNHFKNKAKKSSYTKSYKPKKRTVRSSSYKSKPSRSSYRPSSSSRKRSSYGSSSSRRRSSSSSSRRSSSRRRR